jgi:hypothetical protein
MIKNISKKYSNIIEIFWSHGSLCQLTECSQVQGMKIALQSNMRDFDLGGNEENRREDWRG